MFQRGKGKDQSSMGIESAIQEVTGEFKSQSILFPIVITS